jgi:hypothetical protein
MQYQQLKHVSSCLVSVVFDFAVLLWLLPANSPRYSVQCNYTSQLGRWTAEGFFTFRVGCDFLQTFANENLLKCQASCPELQKEILETIQTLFPMDIMQHKR